MAIVSSLRCVDEVFCFRGAEYPFFDLIHDVQPDVVVLNVDEFADISAEEECCKDNNVELIKLPRIISPSGMCTTRIVESILKRQNR